MEDATYIGPAKSDITGRLKQWWKLYNEKAFENAVLVFSEDCFMYPNNHAPIIGRPAILAFLKHVGGSSQNPGSIDNLQSTLEELTITSPDSAYSVVNSKTPAMTLKSFMIWRKYEGNWYITRDMFNNSGE